MSKKGLTTSVLGSHLGFDVPAVVRRGGAAPLHSVTPEASEPEPVEQGRAAAAIEPEVEVTSSEREDGRTRSREPEPSVESRTSSTREPKRSDVEPLAATEEDEDAAPSLENDARRSTASSGARRKQPAKVESRSSFYRVGTQRAPYERSDGTKTEKAGFTAPHGFKEEINLFCLTNRLGTPSEWIVATLRREMERTRRKS